MYVITYYDTCCFIIIIVIIILHPPFSARLLLTIITIRHYDSSHRFGLLIHDPSEVVIQKVAHASQRREG